MSTLISIGIFLACFVVVFGGWWLSMAIGMYLGENEWADLTGENER